MGTEQSITHRATDTADLTIDQKAKLAAAIVVIRETQGSLKGWSQFRVPALGNPYVLFLLKRRKGKLIEAYHVCRDKPPV